MLGYVRLIEKRRYGLFTFLLSALLLFHTNYIYCVVLLLTVIAHAALCHRSMIGKVLLLTAGIILVNLPFIIWYLPTEWVRYTVFSSSGEHMKLFFKWFLPDIEKTVFPSAMLLFFVLMLVFDRVKRKSTVFQDRSARESLLLPVLFVLFNILIVLLSAGDPFFRYIAPSIPMFVMIAAFIWDRAMRAHAVFGICVAMALLFRINPSAYFYEITHDFDGPIEGIVKYLNANGEADDTVVITYGDLPLKFYTGMRVLGGFTGEPLEPIKSADWVIMRKTIICEKDLLTHQYIRKNINLEDYNKITIDYPDTPFENRENPMLHQFRTVRHEDRVVIYQKLPDR